MGLSFGGYGDITKPPVPMPILLHRMRRFIVTFDNAKRHGAFPVQQHTAEGILFTSGHVVIDTNNFAQKGFISIGEMENAMRAFGNVDIDYLDA